MTFKDREDAGRQLGQALLDLDGRVGKALTHTPTAPAGACAPPS
jgi:predicted phosphoribosyltransferase